MQAVYEHAPFLGITQQRTCTHAYSSDPRFPTKGAMFNNTWVYDGVWVGTLVAET